MGRVEGWVGFISPGVGGGLGWGGVGLGMVKGGVGVTKGGVACFDS